MECDMWQNNSRKPAQQVRLGSAVEIRHVYPDGEEYSETITIDRRHDPGSLSSVATRSKLGRALTGMSVGDLVTLVEEGIDEDQRDETEAVTKTVEVVSISRVNSHELLD